MASKFVLTAVLALQPPKNVKQVVNSINSQLQGVTAPVNLAVNSQGIAKANAQLKTVSATAASTSKSLTGAARSADSLGSALGSAARRFASITLATGFFLAITRAIGSAVGRAIEFEKEMLKISQVTGKTVRQLGELSGEVTRLATSLGVSSEEILNSARTLSQAGFAAKDVTKAIEILAQTDLAATFDNIKDTTEGAVAILRQFRSEVVAAGGEVQFLRQAMDAINAVSKSFAVESADLISVVRRTGGVFEAAGGKLNELIALFTSVRGTTRETADTIATGFRTIFTRIQRTETIDQLKELGIVLQDSTGKFVGPLEAIKRLSIGLSSLDPRDFRFNEIVEQLGGFRQIGKVIPLIKQYQTSTQALAIANESLGSTADDAAIAQQGLGNQFAKLKEKFDATIRSLTESDTFRSMAESAILLAESILRIVEALEPLLPLLAALSAFKMGQIAVPALGRFSGVGGRNEGGKIHRFASGGYVPGQGSRDTVPAMLTPGEFVIKKSSVKKIGAEKLAGMNGYAGGGVIKNFGTGVLDKGTDLGTKTYTTTFPLNRFTDSSVISKLNSAGANLKLPSLPQGVLPAAMDQVAMEKITGSNSMKLAGVGALYPKFVESMDQGMSTGLDTTVTALDGIAGGLEVPPMDKAQKEAFIKTLKGKYGHLFEQVIQRMSGIGFDAGQDAERPVDLTAGLGNLAGVFPELAGLSQIELKSSLSAANKANKTTKIPGLHQKIINSQGMMINAGEIAQSAATRLKAGQTLGAGSKRGSPQRARPQGPNPAGTSDRYGPGGGAFNLGGTVDRYAKGGSVDTVPAMLTPGEYVINKSSAQSIGYSNLNRMNKHGVSNFNAGGPVQYLAAGSSGSGVGSGSMGGAGMSAVNTSMTALAEAATKVSLQLETLKVVFTSVADDFAPLQTAIMDAAQGISITDDMMKNSITAALQPLGQAMMDASKGISVTDDMMKASITAALAPLGQAMMDAAKGISMADDTMLRALETSTAPLKKSILSMDAEFKKFNTQLMAKLKYFDTLKVSIKDMSTVMNDFSLLLLEKTDDFDVLKPSVFDLKETIDYAALKFLEVSDDFNPVKAAILGLTTSLGTAAQSVNVTKGGGLMKINSPLNQMALGLGKTAKALMSMPSFIGQLNGAMARMVEALNLGAVGIQNVTVVTGSTDAELLALQEVVAKLKIELSELTAKAGQTGDQLVTTGTGARAGAGGGGAGASAIANQFLMVAMMAGMMVTQFSNMEEATKKATDAAIMLGSIFGMMGMAALDQIATKMQEMAAAKIAAAEDLKKAAAAALAGEADAEKTVATKAATGATMMASVMMLGLSVAVGYIAFNIIKAGEAAKKMSSEIAEGMRDFSRGEGDMNLNQAKAKAQGALKLEAQAAGAFDGAIAGVVVALAIASVVVISIASAGTATALAIVAAGALIGSAMGESGAIVNATLSTATDVFVTSAFHAAQALNQFSAAQKEIQVLQLEGVQKLNAQVDAAGKLASGTNKSTTELVLGRGMLTSLDPTSAESKTLNEQIESSSELLSAAADANFQAAEEIANSMRSTASDLREEGKSFDQIMASPDLQRALTTYKANVYAAVQAQSLLNGSAEKLAKARLGLTDVAEADYTLAQKRLLIAETAAQSDIKATQVSEASTEATKKRIKAEDEATRAAIASDAQKLAANRLLAMQASELASSLNVLAVSLIGFSTQLSLMDVELGSLTGSIRQYKDKNVDLIATLNSGNVTPEAAEAARKTGDRFGIRPEVNKLLNDIKSSDELRDTLTDKGLKQLSGNIADPAISGDRLKNFLKDANIDLSGLAPEIRKEIMDMLKDGLKPDEIEKIVGMVNDSNKERIKVLQELAKAEQQYLSGLFKFGAAIIKSQNEYMNSLKFLTDVQARGASRMAQAEGRELSIQEVAGQGVANRRAGMGAVGLAGGAGVAGTKVQLRSVTEKMAQADEALRILIEGGGDSEDIIKVQNAQQQLVNQTNVLKNNLKELANQADLAAAMLGEIEIERSKREAVRNLISDFTFANNEGRRQMDQNMMALQRVMQTGNLNSIPDEMRGAVGSLLDQLKDVDLGGGMTGGEVKKRLEMQTANQLAIRQRGFGLTPEEMKKIFERTTKEEKLINDLKALNIEEQNAARALAQLEFAETQRLITALAELRISLNNAALAVGANPANLLAPPGAGGAGAVLAGPNAKGGPVNLSVGGVPSSDGMTAGMTLVDFKKQGPDVIPSMLSKGEFVVNPTAARNNAGILEDINNNKVSYFRAGGWTDGSRYNGNRGHGIDDNRAKIENTLKTTKTGFEERAAEYVPLPTEYKESMQKADLETTFPMQSELKDWQNWWPEKGKRAGYSKPRFDELIALKEKIASQTDGSAAEWTTTMANAFTAADNPSDPKDFMAMQRGFVSANLLGGAPGMYNPLWWKVNLKKNAFIDTTQARDDERTGMFATANQWASNVLDYTWADNTREQELDHTWKWKQINEDGSLATEEDLARPGWHPARTYTKKDLFTNTNPSDLNEIFPHLIPASADYVSGDAWWQAKFQSMIKARTTWSKFNDSYKKPGGYFENLKEFKGYDDVDWSPLSKESDAAHTLEMYGGLKKGFVADDDAYKKMANKGPANEMYSRLMRAPNNAYAWKPMDKDDYTTYGIEGIGEKFGRTWYNKTLASDKHLPMQEFRDNIYSKYDFDLDGYIENVRTGNKELGEYYSMYKGDGTAEEKANQEAKLDPIIRKIQAITPPDEAANNQLGAGGGIETQFNEAAWASVFGDATHAKGKDGGVINEMDYSPWDAESWGGGNFSNIYQDVDKAKKGSGRNITGAQAIYKNMRANQSPAEIGKSLDDASMLLKGRNSSSGAQHAINKAVVAPAIKPLDPDMLAEVGVLDVDAIVKNFNSPFMTDDKKKAGLVGAWKWYQEQAKKAQMAGNAVAAGNFMRIAPIFPYVKREAGAGVDFKDHRFIGQMPATAKLFNAMFPYFAGTDETNALAANGLGKFGSIESQIREGAKYGFVTGLGKDGPVFNGKALENRTRGKGANDELKVGDDTKASVRLLYHWISSKHMDLNNVGDPPGEHEQWMMHRFFNMINVDNALNHLEANSLRGMAALSVLQNKKSNDGKEMAGTSGPDILSKVLGQGKADKVTGNIQAAVRNIPQGFATGGHVGSTQMSPSGTDTVPAMLTPGEFVMKKSAVDKYGVGFMASLNGGNIGSGGPYFDEGGIQPPKPEVIPWRAENDQPDEIRRDSIGDWLNSGNRYQSMTAQQLLGDKLRLQLPADVGGVLKLYKNAGLLGVGRTGKFSQMRGIWNLERSPDLWPELDRLSGYVSGSVMLGEPPSDRDIEINDSQLMAKPNFGKIFGEAAMSKYFPTFDNVRREAWFNPNAADEDGNLGNGGWMRGTNVSLFTPFRDFTLQSLGATEKFFGEVQGVFNKISNTPLISEQLPGMGRLAKDGSGFSGELVNGREVNRTRLGYMPDSRVQFGQKGGGWKTEGAEFDNVDAMMNEFPYQWLDVASQMLGTDEWNQYGRAQYAAKINAIDLGNRIYRKEYMPRLGRGERGGIIPGKIDRNIFPAEPANQVQMNTGGSIPGTGNRDTVPAMLTPGEFVMKKSAVDKYGAGFMSSVNSGLAHFANGGPVGPAGHIAPATSQFGAKDDTSRLLKSMSSSLSSIDAGQGSLFSGISNSVSDLGSTIFSSLSAFETAFLGFSKLSSMLNDTINSIANLNITHSINMSGTLDIPGFDQQSIDNIVNTIGEQVARSANEKLNRALKDFKDKLDNRAV